MNLGTLETRRYIYLSNTPTNAHKNLH